MELEIIFSNKLVVSKKVTFNLTKNIIHHIPAEDPSRDGSQWLLDSIRRRYKSQDEEENHHLASGNGTSIIK